MIIRDNHIQAVDRKVKSSQRSMTGETNIKALMKVCVGG
jgi:hypothetical protein